MAVSFIGGGNQSTPEKTTDLLQVTDKFYNIMSYRVDLVVLGFKLLKLAMSYVPYGNCARKKEYFSG
jgi:hypothetical protein